MQANAISSDRANGQENEDQFTRPPRSIGAQLDALPIGRFHYRLIGVIGAGLFLDAFELALAGGVLGALAKSGWSDLHSNGMFVTMTFVGFIIGCLVAAFVGDRLGRKLIYQANLIIFGAASLGAAIAPSINVLIVLRLFMGIGLGAELVLGFATLSEFVPSQHRGKLVTFLSFIAQTGVFASSLVGLWVIPHLGWRAMFVIGGTAAVFVWFLRKFMPESPRWLEQMGRIEEAQAVVAQIAGNLQPAQIRPASVAAPASKPLAKQERGTVLDLVRGSQWKRSLLSLIILCTMQVCLYGMVTWLPTFFVQQGFDIVKSLQWNTIMTLGGPAGGLIGYALADKVGRKPMLVTVGLLGIALSIAYVQLRSEWLLMAVGFALVSTFYVIVVVGVSLYVPEMFPTKVRMRGTGLCSMVARILAAVMQFAIPPLFAFGGIGAIVTCVAITLFTFTVSVLLLGVETKGKPLEEIAQ
jgi:MFS transporter, putative metabolite:H+ symporter